MEENAKRKDRELAQSFPEVMSSDLFEIQHLFLSGRNILVFVFRFVESFMSKADRLPHLGSKTVHQGRIQY